MNKLTIGIMIIFIFFFPTSILATSNSILINNNYFINTTIMNNYIVPLKNIFIMSLLNNECFYQYWVHSYEEDEQIKKVYRLSSFDFPPSFGREAFEIKKTGEVIFYFPGKDDRRTSITGQLEVQDKDNVIIKANHLNMKILSCENDRLVIQER